MTTTQHLGDARPEAGQTVPAEPRHRTPRRLGRFTVATAVLASLVGGGLVATATAAPANAAPAATALKAPVAAKKKAKTSTRVTFSVDRTFYRGAPPVLKAKVTTGGKKATGKARLIVSGKVRKTFTVKNGTGTVRLPKNLSTGKHRVRVSITPSGGKYATKYTSVRASKYTSRVVEQAVKYRGTPYRYGGTSPRGFDCSGFTSYVYKKASVKKLSRTSSGQRHAGKTVSRRSAKPGDLIWTPGHVAIYVGNGEMIDAPRPGKTIQVRSIWQKNPKFLRVSTKAVTI